MTGDYTKVPLRRDDRWTGARLQQGRVLVEHEWNLNLDATARALADTARDLVGPAGVPQGSTAFAVGVVTTPGLDLEIAAGRIWVDGLAAFAPATFRYSQQERISPALPAGGRVLVYLEVFQEHVQPAEDWAALVDPALHPVDSAARTRVGWRVRAVPTTQTSCGPAMTGAGLVALSTGRLSIDRTAPAPSTGGCAPPGDPRGTVPDGLFRVEALDAGTAGTARFAWSFENGAAAVPVRTVAADTVTLAITGGVAFARDELVEVSWAARRQDRVNHGQLYRITDVTPGAGGDVLRLSRAVTAPAGAAGLVVRRWDGETAGAAAQVQALRGTQNLGVVFTAGAGSYAVGDWWGAALRPEADPAVERRVSASPDGVPRAFVPLALVNLDTKVVESDCRPKFRPLTEIRDRSTCTVTAFPGDDLQAAVNALPAAGGELCLAAGEYPVHATVQIKRPRVTVTGVGPATVIRSVGGECALRFDGCADARISDVQVVGGPPGGVNRDGAVTAVDCADVTVAGTVLSCLDAAEPQAAALAARNCLRVRVTGNQVAVGAWQTGVLVTGGLDVLVRDNTVRYVSAKQAGVDSLPREMFAVVLAATIRLVPAAQLQPAVLAFAQEFDRRSATLIGQYGTRRRASVVFARYVTGPTRPADIPESWWTGLRDALAGYLAGGAGITAAGAVNSIRVLDNVVHDCAQGIHVGYSGGQGRAVQVRGNTVRVMVPFDHRRDRHAVAVSNAHSTWITDTFAELALTGRRLTKLSTPVDGVSLYGQLGPCALVRQNSFLGFTTGVRCAQSAAAPNVNNRAWVVAETVASGGTALVTVLPVVVENIFPKPA
ncbi:hypothetical protein Drose_13580 [Dactylosporangium roseum]|uniref:Right handed beta helix domain-containing protein n=1 Tax=Dactylosporangium roseum TaxID=47989 RepID=A0ABY5ZEH9_9ACTN|nr:DUF6519 domain-containing protein [Dactylosporangium roseum]UWZ39162.1 hypothetical protein Drose_13580 [Dactylosporangium roseum]